MRNPLSVVLILSLAACPVLGEAPAAKEGGEKTAHIVINRPAAEWQIRQLTSELGKDPDNSQCRLQLASALETMARYYEERRDFLKSWRYYEVAAHVLNYPKQKGLKARCEQDARKARESQQARIEYLSNLKLIGWVYTTFNWRKYKELAPQAASDYTTKISMPIRRNWSVAKRMYNFDLDTDQKPAIIVAFNIHRDGAISDVKLTKSCGQKKLDAIAVQVVKTTAKMPPLLTGMGDVLPVEAQFVK